MKPTKIFDPEVNNRKPYLTGFTLSAMPVFLI
jgi:hypothetical protein